MRIFTYLLILLVSTSCNKNLNSKWDVDVLIPLAYASLDMYDLVADSLINQNLDNSLTLVYSSEDLKLNFDTLAKLPETSSVEFFNIPFSSIEFSAGATFPTPLEELELDIENVELKEMIIKKGKIGILIRNYIRDSLNSTFQIVSSSLNGQPLIVNELIPASEEDNPGVFYQEYDVSGYHIDLTGENGDQFNTIVSDLDVIINPDGNGVTVSNEDSLVIITSYIGVEASYIKGNFGQEEIVIDHEMVELDFFTDLNPEVLNLNDPVINLNLINGVGAEFKISIDELLSINQSTGITVPLNHSIIGNTINVNRAIDNGTPIPYELNFEIDPSNSNIEEWLENIPDRIEYSLNAELNPLGNISGGNDFIYCESEFGFDFELEIPLCINAENFTLSDTLNLNLGNEDNIDNVQSGLLNMYVENSFPFQGEVQIYMLNNQVISDSLLFEGTINGLPQTSSPTLTLAKSVLSAEVSQEKFEKLKMADELLVKALLSTAGSEFAKFYSDQRMDLSFVLEANYLVNAE